MTGPLIVGTRSSPLARIQTDLVVAAIARRHRGLTFDVRPIRTSGDQDLRPGGSPDFTDAIDRALREGTVDLAVHSAKDLPLGPIRGLSLAATPRRADPRDCLVMHRPGDAKALHRNARVGSSSPRRRAQLLRWRPDLEVVEVRGNVDTRLRKARAGEVDAVMLAVAGLQRLGRGSEIDRVLPIRQFLPAPAQGALAVVVREDDRTTAGLVRSIDDPRTHAAVDAERAFATELGGDCTMPLGVLARVERGRLRVDGEILSPDGRLRLSARSSGALREGAAIGRGLGRTVLDRGAAALLGRRAREFA